MGKVMFLRKGEVHTAPKVPFPPEPAFYTELVGTYTSSQTIEAPEDGWFQIEVFGASGAGGTGAQRWSSAGYNFGTAGSGGGGGYSCSRVKLKKGDTIVVSPGAVGSDTVVTINSSLESYSTMRVTSGENGDGATQVLSGSYYYCYGGEDGGAGGVASGGNVSNINGNNGLAGKGVTGQNSPYFTLTGGAGGAADALTNLGAASLAYVQSLEARIAALEGNN